jgi:hypothetical protein
VICLGLLGLGAAIGCNEDGSWGEGWDERNEEKIETETSATIYGADNRMDWKDAASNLRRVADATAIVVSRAALTSCDANNCTYVGGLPSATDTVPPHQNQFVAGLCFGEKFGPPTQIFGQSTMLNAYCSSFLVGPDLMVSAGHCFVGVNGSLASAQTACANTQVIFDFKADAGGNTPLTVQTSKVRSCSTVLGVRNNGLDDDWVVFRLNAPIADDNRRPLAIRRGRKVSNRIPLAHAGYPAALPLKIAHPGKLVDNDHPNTMRTTLDAFSGDSGGPVFHRDTETVEGIIAAGPSDFTFDYSQNPLGCLRAQVCSETLGCPMPPNGATLEFATRAKRAAAHIPSLSPRTFDGIIGPNSVNEYQIYSADFNGDGYSDILYYRPGPEQDWISWSNGVNRTFRDERITANGNYRPILGDFDGDGNGDIFWYRPGPSADFFDWGTAQGTFVPTTDPIGVDGDYIVAAGDFDGDGTTDIVWHAPGSANPDYISWFVKGERRYVDDEFAVSGTYRLVTGDFDGNGRDEIVWYRPGSATDSVWHFSASRVRTSVDITVGGDYRPIPGDFDGDGFTDILWYGVGSLADGLTWGSTSRTAFPISPFSVGGTYVTTSGDFNGDSASDIFWHRPGTADDYIDFGMLKPR